MAERLNNTIETQINDGNTIVSQIVDNNQPLQTVIQDVPQVQTVLQNGINISSQINAPFVEVTSVNGKTGDVITEPVVGVFEPNHYYLKNTMISYNDTLYYAKANFTSGNSFNANDWYAVEGTQITVDSAFSTTSENPVQNKVITTKINEIDRFYRGLVPLGTAIAANKNLNTTEFLRVGKYYCSLNATVATLTNCPTGSAFMMEVFSPLSTTIDNETTGTWVYRSRLITELNGTMWYQGCNSNGTANNWSYGSWRKVANTGDITNSINASMDTKYGSVKVNTYATTDNQYVKIAEISYGTTSNDNLFSNFRLDTTSAGTNGYLKSHYFGVGVRMGQTSLSTAKFEYFSSQDFGATQFDFDFKRDVKVTYKYTAGSSGVAHNLKMQIWLKMGGSWRMHYLWPLQNSYKNDYGVSRANTTSTDSWTYYNVQGNSSSIGQATYLETGFTELNCKDVVGVPYLNSYSSRPTTANTTPDGKGGLRTFLASSSMTTGKPGNVDGHIIQLDWDGTNGYDSQIYLENGNNGNLYIRGQSAGTWGNWKQIAQTADLPSAATTSSLGTVQIGDGLDITNTGVLSTELSVEDGSTVSTVVPSITTSQIVDEAVTASKIDWDSILERLEKTVTLDSTGNACLNILTADYWIIAIRECGTGTFKNAHLTPYAWSDGYYFVHGDMNYGNSYATGSINIEILMIKKSAIGM